MAEGMTVAVVGATPTDRKTATMTDIYSKELMALIAFLLWFLKVGFLIFFFFLPCPYFSSVCFSFTEVRCPPPPSIANGRHSGQPSDTHLPGSAVQYTCMDGYSLVGNASISCTARGTWSRPRPRCEGLFVLASFTIPWAPASFLALGLMAAVQVSRERQRPMVPRAGGAPPASVDSPFCPPVRTGYKCH